MDGCMQECTNGVIYLNNRQAKLKWWHDYYITYIVVKGQEER